MDVPDFRHRRLVGIVEVKDSSTVPSNEERLLQVAVTHAAPPRPTVQAAHVVPVNLHGN